jgi:hypothetical protein
MTRAILPTDSKANDMTIKKYDVQARVCTRSLFELTEVRQNPNIYFLMPKLFHIKQKCQAQRALYIFFQTFTLPLISHALEQLLP